MATYGDQELETSMPSSEDEQQNEKDVSALVGIIQSKFQQCETTRRDDELRWLQAYHNYRGRYYKDVKFRENEKSRVFVKVTKTKVLAAYGQLIDVLLEEKIHQQYKDLKLVINNGYLLLFQQENFRLES